MKSYALSAVAVLRLAIDVSGLACPAPMRLKNLLQSEIDGSRDSEMPILLPCCYDGLTGTRLSRVQVLGWLSGNRLSKMLTLAFPYFYSNKHVHLKIIKINQLLLSMFLTVMDRLNIGDRLFVLTGTLFTKIWKLISFEFWPQANKMAKFKELLLPIGELDL